MIGIVISDQERLAENRLTIAVRDRREEIGRRIGDQVAHRLEIGLERGDRLVPSGWRWRRIALGPIAARKLRRNMPRVAAELQNIPLRDPHVLDDPPRRMWHSSRPFATQLGRQLGHSRGEVDVRSALFEKFDEMLT